MQANDQTFNDCIMKLELYTSKINCIQCNRIVVTRKFFIYLSKKISEEKIKIKYFIGQEYLKKKK